MCISEVGSAFKICAYFSTYAKAPCHGICANLLAVSPHQWVVHNANCNQLNPSNHAKPAIQLNEIITQTAQNELDTIKKLLQKSSPCRVIWHGGDFYVTAIFRISAHAWQIRKYSCRILPGRVSLSQMVPDYFWRAAH